MPVPELSVVIPVWAFDDARADLAHRSLQSFRTHTVGQELIVVDNGSVPPLRKSRIRFDRNVGYAAAVNAGLCLATGDWIAVGSCDVIVSADWWRPLLGDDVRGPAETAERKTKTAYRGGFYGPLWVMPRKVVRTVGGLDLSWTNLADRDYAIRIAQAGFQIRRLPEVQVIHEDAHRSWAGLDLQDERDRFKTCMEPPDMESGSGTVTLDDLAFQHGTDKGSRCKTPLSPKRYTTVYERLLGPIRTRPITLLEIGVWKGASLRMWSEWMPRARIIGVDRRRYTGNVGRAILCEGDQGDADFMSEVARRFGPFDVVVDDGSHRHEDQMVSLRALAPHTRGLYFIEDLHATPKTVAWLKASELDFEIFDCLAVIRL